MHILSYFGNRLLRHNIACLHGGQGLIQNHKFCHDFSHKCTKFPRSTVASSNSQTHWGPGKTEIAWPKVSKPSASSKATVSNASSKYQSHEFLKVEIPKNGSSSQLYNNSCKITHQVGISNILPGSQRHCMCHKLKFMCCFCQKLISHKSQMHLYTKQTPLGCQNSL